MNILYLFELPDGSLIEIMEYSKSVKDKINAFLNEFDK